MPATAQETALHIHTLEVESFLRLRCLRIDAAGRHCIISGPNGAGKTTALDAIWVALKGAPAKQYPEPIHRGADRARIALDLGEFHVERTFTPAGSRLTVTSADGSKLPKPQQFLDSLFTAYSLDPFAFLERRPQDQVDDVLAIAGVKSPVAEVMALCKGVVDDGDKPMLTPRPGESANAYLMRLSGDETGFFYARRREAHRACEQKRHALEEQREILGSLGGPVNGTPQASSATLLAEMEALNKDRAKRASLQAAATVAQGELCQAADRLAVIERQRSEEVRAIEELEHQMSQRRANVGDLDARLIKGAGVIVSLKGKASDAEKAVASCPDPSPRITELSAALKRVEADNAALAKRRHAAEQHERLAVELEQAQRSHKLVDDTLEGLRDIRVHLLDGVDLGVPGLTVGDAELKLLDISFRQASRAEQIRVACAVAMRSNARIKILRIDDGEHLDRESRELVMRLAADNGYEVFMTRVADCADLQIEFVDS